MKDYSHIGLNTNLIKTNSLMGKRQSLVQRDGIIDVLGKNPLYEIQTKYLKVGEAAQDDLVQVTGTAVATGTIAIGTHVVATTTISPNPRWAGAVIMGQVSQEIYEGTAVDTNYLIYPAPGGSIAADKFRCFDGYRQLGGSEINHRNQTTVYNNSGSAVPVYAVAKWKFVMDQAGNAS